MNFRGLLMSVWLLQVIHAEGDPIPEDMFEKITGGTVHSISDLKRLLQIDSVDDEEDVSYASRNGTRIPPRGNVSHSRVIRSVDAEMAVIAECKTRTEVFEITRKMVDPTNANFLVWPPCVEVQRCSGCCNSRNIKCVPSRIHIRHVQVRKIIPSQKKNTQRVIIALEDHLECKCESVQPPVARSHHHTNHEPKMASDLQTTTVTPTPAPKKQENPLRLSKRKNRKFKQGNSKKELKDLLAT
ncbi:platelet-derived growth factor subunit B [Bombina bombina]|uniref:platelet-derived growth factor subunit B n=1 Tax=Bombina bombina TaxID=8345 RepID=UPI00235B274D|nr:platelet-derived growth factor subunit B [Bombina bombina]